MSLAGKILSVLVTLMLFVCIWLTSQVAAVESRHSEALALQDALIAKQTQELADLKVAAYGASQDLLAARDETDHALVLLRQGLEDQEDRLNQAEESHARAGFLVETETEINETSDAVLARRKAENEDYKARLQATRDELKELSEENDRLLAEANGLRDRFQNVLAENQKLLEELAGRPLPAYSQARTPVVR